MAIFRIRGRSFPFPFSQRAAVLGTFWSYRPSTIFRSRSAENKFCVITTARLLLPKDRL